MNDLEASATASGAAKSGTRWQAETEPSLCPCLIWRRRCGSSIPRRDRQIL